jgi:hypothetical protein
VLRARLVPLWTLFPVERSARLAERYLSDRSEPARILLFSHGTDSIGLAGVERWRRLGTLVAVDEHAFPRDFATFFRYGRALERLGGGAPPGRLAPSEAEALLARVQPPLALEELVAAP